MPKKEILNMAQHDLSGYPKYKFECGHIIEIDDVGFSDDHKTKVCPICGESKAIKLFKCRWCGRIMEKTKNTPKALDCNSRLCKKKAKRLLTEGAKAGSSNSRPDGFSMSKKERLLHEEASAKAWDCVNREKCISMAVNCNDVLKCHDCPYYEKGRFDTDHFANRNFNYSELDTFCVSL